MNPISNDRQRAGAGDRGKSFSEASVFLEGMKVLFDDKVGLYPVYLVKEKPDHEAVESPA